MEWDDEKRQRNLQRHGWDFVAIKRFEWRSAVLRPSYSSEHGHRRFPAIGVLDADLVAAVFSGLGAEALSLTSLRRASRAERREYAEAQEGS
ncbi:MAG: BrnT family toxin [Devosia sp.]|nr:BrnT family toxin [Devosia sp.]MBN9314474.1 BrnT family toxin [Devosia sp.]